MSTSWANGQGHRRSIRDLRKPGKRCRLQMSPGFADHKSTVYRSKSACADLSGRFRVGHWEQMDRVASQCQVNFADVAELFIPDPNSRLLLVQILDSFLSTSQIFCTCPSSVLQQSQREWRDMCPRNIAEGWEITALFLTLLQN